jgi:hypothetical protein
MRYQIVAGPDDIAWVTIQPLIEDCKEILANANKIDISTLDHNEQEGHKATVVAITSVIEFLNSLMIEFMINKRIQDENSDRQTTH